MVVLPPKTALSKQTKRFWRRVDGVILLDKPRGITSNAALQIVRRLFSAAKAGHTGTLDPLATGLLPLCLGEATKFSTDLLDADKTYEADLFFGIVTDTGDADGNVIRRYEPGFSQQDLEAALQRFKGEIRQVPPMYSALKKDGRPLYQLARQGVEVEREARTVTIHELALLESTVRTCRIRVSCSKGTYVRTLAEDIGEALGCGAHLIALRRTRVGDLSIAQAVSLDFLETCSEAQRSECLLSSDTLLQSLSAIILQEQEAKRFSHGNPVSSTAGTMTKCRVYFGEQLLGLGEVDVTGRLCPRRLVASDTVEGRSR